MKDAQSNTHDQPIGYYCKANDRLYKHRESGASHHVGQPCCVPVVPIEPSPDLDVARLIIDLYDIAKESDEAKVRMACRTAAALLVDR